MKKSILLFIALTAGMLFSTWNTASAQQASPEAQMREHKAKKHKSILEVWAKRLDLSQEQVDKLQPAMTDYTKRLGEIKDGNPSKMDSREDYIEARIAFEEKVLAVLTPEQAKRFERMRLRIRK